MGAVEFLLGGTNRKKKLAKQSSFAVAPISICDGEGSTEHVNWLVNTRSPTPLPLPPPATPPKDHIFKPALISFTYNQISAACDCFNKELSVYNGSGRVCYQASFMVEATVTRLSGSSQPYENFVTEVSAMASLQHPHVCKLIGFHARQSGDRILVYERLAKGSLDRILYGNGNGNGSGSSTIEWCNRIKIALGAAKGLAFLHEEGPFQAMYSEFKVANIQIDSDFNPKLSDYGFAGFSPSTSSQATSSYNLAPETVAHGLVTRKSNVWSFGTMLLELLTGRQNMECDHLVEWCVPFLNQKSKLLMMMDPRLSTQSISIQAANTVADLALRCLQKEPSDRPTMRAVSEILETIPNQRIG